MNGKHFVKGAGAIAFKVDGDVLEPKGLEPSDENRRLSVTLDSEGYSTSSDIPLEGRNSARLNVIELRDVPSGLYEVRAELSGMNGPIATTLQVVKIQPAPGRAR